MNFGSYVAWGLYYLLLLFFLDLSQDSCVLKMPKAEYVIKVERVNCVLF